MAAKHLSKSKIQLTHRLFSLSIHLGWVLVRESIHLFFFRRELFFFEKILCKRLVLPVNIFGISRSIIMELWCKVSMVFPILRTNDFIIYKRTFQMTQFINNMVQLFW